MGLFSFFKKKEEKVVEPKKLGDVLASNVMDFSLSKSNQYIEDFVAIDFETTGLDYMSDKIIEIGAVHYNGDKIVDEFHTYVDPKTSIPHNITKLTGISKKTVMYAPTEENAAQMLYDYIKPIVKAGAVLVAHNAVFDISFLSALFIPNGYVVSFDFCDTLAMSRILYRDETDSFKLGAMADLLSIETEKAHGALEDAKVCGQLFYKLINKHIENNKNYWESLSGLERDILRKVRESSPELFDELYITYNKSPNSLSFYCVNDFITIKMLKTKSYIIIPASYKNELPYEMETLKNGNFKFYFNFPEEIDAIKPILAKRIKAQDYMFDREFNTGDERAQKYARERLRDRLLSGYQIIVD